MPMQTLQKPQANYGAYGTIAGAAVGSGVPVIGTLAGAGIGGQIGSTIQGMSQAAPNVKSLGQGSEASAIARKNAAEAQDNLKVLQNAEMHVAQLPERERQIYAPPIIKARMMAEAERGLA